MAHTVSGSQISVYDQYQLLQHAIAPTKTIPKYHHSMVYSFPLVFRSVEVDRSIHLLRQRRHWIVLRRRKYQVGRPCCFLPLEGEATQMHWMP